MGPRNATVPPDLAAALAASPEAARTFETLGKTLKHAVILAVVTARSAEARDTQLRRAVAALEGHGAGASPRRRGASTGATAPVRARR